MLSKGICNLCLVEKELINKSHIFSEFLYKDFYDDKHKMESFAPKDFLEGNSIEKRVSSGEYEGGILCMDCENTLSKYETYARKIFFGGNFPTNELPLYEYFKRGDQEFTKISNINYSNLKLFVLSLIWRASISKRPMFKEINLQVWNEKLRIMLHDGNPGEEGDFPIMCWHFLKDYSVPADALIIGQPSIQTVDGILMCKLLIRKFWIFCAITEGLDHLIFNEFTIKKSNQWILASVPKGMGAQFIMNHFNIKK